MKRLSAPALRVFHEGDEVVLAHGTYQGTSGIFVRLRADTNWADVTECDGTTRRHPMAWLARPSAVLEPGAKV